MKFWGYKHDWELLDKTELPSQIAELQRAGVTEMGRAPSRVAGIFTVFTFKCKLTGEVVQTCFSNTGGYISRRKV